MPVADTAYVAQVGNFFDVNDLTYLDSPLRRASRIIRRWIGDSSYAEAVAATTGDLREAVREAEALIAVREALPAVNRHDTGKGITVTSGTNSPEGSHTTRFLAPEEVTQEQKRLTKAAVEMISDYLLAGYSQMPAPVYYADFEQESTE